MATVDFHKKAAFNFLSAVTEQFKSTYAQGVIDRAAAYELNGFSEVLQSRMEYWTANPEDKVRNTTQKQTPNPKLYPRRGSCKPSVERMESD